MKYEFKSFDMSYYEKVRRFLIDLSQKERIHINWNWARWEWMFFHPDFDRSLMEKIGLWFVDDALIGVAIFDHYLGEAFVAAKKGFEKFEKELLDYAVESFCDENGLGIAVNDTDSRTVALFTEKGFLVNEQAENVLELDLSTFDFSSRPQEDISLESINIEKDLYKHHELLWRGFDHEGQAPMDKATLELQRKMLSAPHMNMDLHVAAKNAQGDFVSYCGLWYEKETDYVYVEPVCTIPQYRGRGLAKAVLTEALQRAYALGARKAYVISDSEFYKRLGFKQHSHYTFYWYNETVEEKRADKLKKQE